MVSDDFAVPGGSPSLAQRRAEGRAPRKGPTAAAQREADAAWDARPVVYTLGGEVREFFTLGALAKALDRNIQTVRGWERDGYLPQSTFRAPSVTGTGPRLYTREFIQAMVALSKKYRLRKNQPLPHDFVRGAQQAMTEHMAG